MKIKWNKVTWYSKLLALALFVTLPFIGFYFGVKYARLEGSVDPIAPKAPSSSSTLYIGP